MGRGEIRLRLQDPRLGHRHQKDVGEKDQRPRKDQRRSYRRQRANPPFPHGVLGALSASQQVSFAPQSHTQMALLQKPDFNTVLFVLLHTLHTCITYNVTADRPGPRPRRPPRRVVFFVGDCRGRVTAAAPATERPPSPSVGDVTAVVVIVATAVVIVVIVVVRDDDDSVGSTHNAAADAMRWQYRRTATGSQRRQLRVFYTRTLMCWAWI